MREAPPPAGLPGHRTLDAPQLVGEAAQRLVRLGCAAKADSEPGSWSGLLVVY